MFSFQDRHFIISFYTIFDRMNRFDSSINGRRSLFSFSTLSHFIPSPLNISILFSRLIFPLASHFKSRHLNFFLNFFLQPSTFFVLTFLLLLPTCNNKKQQFQMDNGSGKKEKRDSFRINNARIHLRVELLFCSHGSSIIFLLYRIPCWQIKFSKKFLSI